MPTDRSRSRKPTRLGLCLEQNGILDRELAKLAGLGRNQIWMYRTGSNEPTGRIGLRIVEALRGKTYKPNPLDKRRRPFRLEDLYT